MSTTQEGSFRMRRRVGVIAVLAIAGALAVGALASFAVAQSGGQRFGAERMQGSFEIPAVSTVARGEFEARLVNTSTGPAIDYELSYSGLQGTVTQAHIHFAQNFANGGIVAWLCETSTNMDASTEEVCPQTATGPNVVEGRITAAQITAIGGANAGQQISAGDFDEVVAAIRAGLTYANVHTNLSPGGEIRAQIRRGGGDGGDD
jgi:CHRD domain